MNHKQQSTWRLSANLGFLWHDLPLLDRLQCAHDAGFQGVEMHWPYDVSPTQVAKVCRDLNLTLLSVNTPQGNQATGDLGLAAQVGRQAEFRQSFQKTLDWARQANASMIHVLPGRSGEAEQSHDCFVENLCWASDLIQGEEMTLLLEAMNPYDRPDYFYHTQEAAYSMIEACGRDNIRLMFDVYHVGMGQGNVLNRLRALMPQIGHIQIASVPERQAPDRGEIRYEAVFEALTLLEYRGWVGCEYRAQENVQQEVQRWTQALDVSL